MSMVMRSLLRANIVNCFKSKSVINNSSRYLSCSSVLFNDRKYSEKHEWITKSGDIGTVGITSYAEKSLGDVVYVQLPELGDKVDAHDEVGAVESVKAASEIYTPVSGTITEVNSTLEDKPGLVNSSCYEDGWLFKLQLKNESEFNDLMNEEQYNEYVKTAH